MVKPFVSIIIVNHNTAHLVSECIESLRASYQGDIECIVVDSGSTGPDVERLSELNAGDTTLVFFKDNVGYAKAVNAGVARSQGGVLVVANPDILFTPGSIESMAKALADLPGCGAVGPRTWWDRDMTFLLPRSDLVTPSSVLSDALMRASGLYSRLRLRSWLKRNLSFWRADSPSEEDMLSGACFMVHRKTWERTGGFDEAFPLYYEDTDWCLRVRTSGYGLYMVPDARIVHYYNQSARQDAGQAQNKFALSMGIYMKKHFPLSFPAVRETAELLRRRRQGGMREDLGALLSPPSFEFRNARERLILLSPVETMIPSAGSFSQGSDFRIPDSLWETLGAGRYYCMSFVTGCLSCDGSWTWEREVR